MAVVWLLLSIIALCALVAAAIALVEMSVSLHILVRLWREEERAMNESLEKLKQREMGTIKPWEGDASTFNVVRRNTDDGMG